MSLQLSPAPPWTTGQLLTAPDNTQYEATGTNRAKPYCEPVTVIGQAGDKGPDGPGGANGAPGANGNPGQPASINCGLSSDTRRIVFTTTDSAGTDGPCELDLDECCDEPPTPVPAVTIMKDCTPAGPHMAGDVVTYSFLVCNTGGETLNNVVVTDSLYGAIGTITSMAQGACQTLTYAHTVTQANVNAGSIVNTATVNATGATSGDPATSSDNHSAPTTTTPAPAITLVKSCDPTGPYQAGDTVTYTFLVTNTGNVPLTGVAVSDPLASSVGPIGNLAVGASTTVTGTHLVTAAEAAAGSLTNTATVTGAPPTGPTVSATDSHTITTEVEVECIEREVCGKLIAPSCVAMATITPTLSPNTDATFGNGPSWAEWTCPGSGVVIRLDADGDSGPSQPPGTIILVGFGASPDGPLSSTDAQYSISGLSALAFDGCPACVEVDYFFESLAQQVVVDFDNTPDITMITDAVQTSPTTFTGDAPNSDGFVHWTEEHTGDGNTFGITGVASGGYFSGMGFGVEGIRVYLPVKVIEESCDGGPWTFVSATDANGNTYTAAQVDY